MVALQLHLFLFMKISKLFHTLYAFLMFLPVIVLPIFSIYSQRHTIDSYTVSREENVVLNFNQHIVNGLPSSTNGWSCNETVSYTSSSFGYPAVSFTSEDSSLFGSGAINIELNNSDVFFLSFYISCDDNDQFSFYFNDDDNNMIFINTFDISGGDRYYYSYRGVFDEDLSSFNLLNFESINDNVSFTSFSYVQLFNLTAIFGTGNEPTASDFNTFLNGRYLPYGDNLLSVGTHNVTYNDTDIGSQFIYQMYNVIDKYFNLKNYMNLGGLYDWFLLNLFNGYNSLVYSIIFNLMIYWLAISVLWLIFDVLMYVPSMIHKMLDKARME